MNLEVLFFDEARHNEALSLLASHSLIAGDAYAAFIFADRKCRSILPSARDFLLRSEASHLVGQFDFAQADLREALKIDPSDVFVNERLMKWGGQAEQEGAALRLIDADARDPPTVARAVAILLEGGAPIVCRLSRQQDSVIGWIVWKGLQPLTLRASREATAEFTLERMPLHYLSGPSTSAAEVEIIDEAGLFVGLDFLLEGRKIGGWREPASVNTRVFLTKFTPTPAPSVSIIVPVYEDLEATEACLRSLFKLTDEVATKIVLIDDCSPNVALRAYLEREAARRDILLLQNENNVGFAASVNRALRHCQVGDVLLVNADVQLPNGAVDRLFAASNAAEAVGTVTPLSNNGELTSFPRPNAANPLPSYEAIAATDQRAALANRDNVVDLPNGVGFCLYIKRACLDAAGPLPEVYGRGYYEDVEFCLKARDLGFRNVCATGIFVGHAGSKSFREEKRSLVVRNLRALEERFPNYKRECAAFVEADPLRSARGAIELLTPIDGLVVLLVSSSGLPRALAEARAEQMDGDDYPVYCTYRADSGIIEFKGQGALPPQSIAFALDCEADVAALRSYLSRFNLRRIELFDFQSIPEVFLSRLVELGARMDIVCADARWFSGHSYTHTDGPCRALKVGRVCDDCLSRPVSTVSDRTSQSNENQRTAALLNSAHAIKPLDRIAEAFARRTFGKKIVVSGLARSAAGRIRRRLPNDHVLAILVPVASNLIDRQIIRICQRLLLDQLATTIVVLGRCLNDLGIMAAGNVFVAGEIGPDDYRRLAVQYRITALMSPYRTCFFGLLDRVADEIGLPKAYFDWSFAALETDEGDLALDPRVCDESAASAIVHWLRAASQSQSAQ